MSYIVVMRIPGGPLVAIQESEGALPALKEWLDEETARFDMEQHILGNRDYEVIEVIS